MELPHHMEDRTGPATTTAVQRLATVQSSMGLYYDISAGRRPVQSLEIEEDADWNICGQFCNIVSPSRKFLTVMC
jgi:hypothetical protein